ncbi:MAG: hypothetical protein JJE03_02690 [Peptostreptococcaceae bacterium]|nr:hypothetical protein [Peptostreptococcaceae bacterium]
MPSYATRCAVFGLMGTAGADNEKITTTTYKYLVPFDHLRPKGALETYFLSNNLNIFTGTCEGGETLIKGLGIIPSPSDDVKRP